MTDTQWPRYQVFTQEKLGAPHLDSGSLHAPDAEIALLNARDVFVRRPECASLWVVPVGEIYAKTAQEIQEASLEPVADPMPLQENETYYVFGKQKQAGTHAWLGKVEAATPEQALRAGIAAFSSGKTVYSWWVLPARSVNASDPTDAESFFDPALDKPFRLSTDFHTVSAMRQIKYGETNPYGENRKDTKGAD